MKKHRIELTDRDMSALAFVLEHVGGRPDGPRAAIDSLIDKIEKAGRGYGDRISGLNPGHVIMPCTWEELLKDMGKP